MNNQTQLEPGKRLCNGCGPRPIGEFYANPARRDGLDTVCRQCIGDRVRARKERERQAMLDSDIAYSDLTVPQQVLLALIGRTPHGMTYGDVVRTTRSASQSLTALEGYGLVTASRQCVVTERGRSILPVPSEDDDEATALEAEERVAIEEGYVTAEQLVVHADESHEDCLGFGYTLSKDGEHRVPCVCAQRALLAKGCVQVGLRLHWPEKGWEAA